MRWHRLENSDITSREVGVQNSKIISDNARIFTGFCTATPPNRWLVGWSNTGVPIGLTPLPACGIFYQVVLKSQEVKDTFIDK